MQRIYRPMRIGFIMAIMAIMLAVYVSALYRMQIYDARPEDEDLYIEETVTRTVTLEAARGNIYDRNGVLLASGRPMYNVGINRDILLKYHTTERNEIVKKLIFNAMDAGIKHNDSFPITMGAPFTYITNMTIQQRNNLAKYLEFMGLPQDIEAPDLLAWMRENYRIDFTLGITEARLIIGVRYELETRVIVPNVSPYVFATDVSTDFVSFILEQKIPGVYVDTAFVREYQTSNAAHVLGYLSPIPAENVDKYLSAGYQMNALVGFAGAELVFEDILRGINGEQTVTMDANGTVTDITVKSVPIPGKHVYLTLDIGIQVAAEDALRTRIESINLERDDSLEKITGGAVVVLAVQSGEVLAAASYPTFNRFTLSRDAGSLFNDPNSPMLNRAMQERYNPGSTFKMITALAGLRHGVITSRYFPVNDVGVYEVLYDTDETYRPTCWIYQSQRVGHGEMDIVQALEQSCNYFFCYVSDRVNGGGESGAEAIAALATEFGLGRSTGIELPEISGILATPENKLRLRDEHWWRADTVQASFGQGMNEFTPLQLANYAATIANGGILHSLTMLRRIVSSDLSDLLYMHEPVVLNEYDNLEHLELIQEGMRAVARSRLGTANRVFGNYPVAVAAKTGTVQIETQDINNGVFICYAPANNPEIAIAVVIEKGGSGAEVMDVARVIFDYYFGKQITAFTVPYGELIP